MGMTATSRTPLPCASAAAGCSATAPAAARAGRWPRSSSTSGCGAGAGRCGSPSPTSSSKTPRRDWAALGGREADVIALAKVRSGDDVPFDEGILFATYATLRSPARQGRRSRLEQVVAWLAGGLDEAHRHAFAGVVVFDEAHAMANAAGGMGSRGRLAPSQQGRAGLKAPVRAARCAGALRLRHRGHHPARSRLRGAAGAVGRGRDPLRDPRGVHQRDGGGRGRGDGGRGAGLEGAGVVSSPRALVCGRRGGGRRARPDRRATEDLRRLRGRVPGDSRAHRRRPPGHRRDRTGGRP